MGREGLTQESRENGCFREVKYEVTRIRGKRKIGQSCRRYRKNCQLVDKERQNAGLLLIKRYNLCNVPACSTVFFQLSLSCATFFQLLTIIFLISSKTSSFHRVLGLPIALLDTGFHLLIFWTLLSSAMRSTWPNQIFVF